MVFCLDHLLGRLEAGGQVVVTEDEMSCPQLLVFVDKYLGLEYFCEVWFIDKIEVRDGRVFIYKVVKHKNIVRKQYI